MFRLKVRWPVGSPIIPRCLLDDGECIALDESREQRELVTNNYDLVGAIAEEVHYQYVLGMNHTVMRF